MSAPTPITENALQRQVIDYLRAVLVNARVFAVPNSARRTRSGRAANAVPGLTPGVPDLVIIAGFGRAYFIELKTRKGVVSPHQEEFLNWAWRNSVPACIARSLDDVRNALAAWGLETREAKQPNSPAHSEALA